MNDQLNTMAESGGDGVRTLRTRARYRFDLLLARGTWAPLLVLAAVSLSVVLLSSVLLTAFDVELSGSDDSSWLERFWQSALRVMDPGTMAADVGWGRRLLSLLVTIFGLLIVGTLIGLIASGVEQSVDAMQRGRSAVIESGHVVILGDSDRLPVVVRQLALANRGRRANAIVVLADRGPVDLGDEVRAAAGDLHGSRLVFRRGDPARVSDLARVGIGEARSVIVLAEEGAHADAGVVKAVLATGAALGGFDRVPIVAELSDPETAESLVDACGGTVYPVAGLQSVARITAVALREPGLNQVVGELLDFRGADVYVRDVGDFVGWPFGECVVGFTNARPIGRMRPDGEVELNPDPQTVLDDDDRLIVIADDRGSPESVTGQVPARGPNSPALRPALSAGAQQEHLLVVGWNTLGVYLLEELARRAAAGSTVEVVYDSRLFDPAEIDLLQAEELTITLTPSTSLIWRLDDEDQTSRLTSIVLLGYRRATSVAVADSRTLLNLMTIRRRLTARGGVSPRVIVELLDADDVNLARWTGADDYVISDAIVSRLMTQLALQPERRPIVRILYATDGPSIHLVPAADLGLDGEVGCAEIISTAYSCGLLAIGWRRAPERGGDLVLNPRTSERVVLLADDAIVVIG